MTIQTRLIETLAANRSSPAFVMDGRTTTYAELGRSIRRIAAWLHTTTHPNSDRPRLAVFGGHAPDTYAAIYAAVLAGGSYVPLNPTFPPDRCAFMARDSGAPFVFVAEADAPAFEPVLPTLPDSVTLVIPRARAAWVDAFPHQRFVFVDDLCTEADAASMPPGRDGDCVYILYTSGSTGKPKGVMVTHGNLSHFITVATGRYGFDAHDRFAQTFDLTFDLSNLALFGAFTAGAAIYPLAQTDKLAAVRFVRQNELTVWYSVPSLALQMARLNMLRPGIMPSLRTSLFCGEPLTVACANQWRAAAPNSRLENHYGPTEATVACSWFTWDERAAAERYRHDIVPIGRPMPGTSFAVAGADGSFVAAGSEGELCIAGAQVCKGYTDEEKTGRAFFQQDDPAGGGRKRWYRTGDRVVFDAEKNVYEYLGRTDHQVKIRGFRVELGEVESVLRAAHGHDGVVVTPQTGRDGTVEDLVAYVERHPHHPDAEALMQACRNALPEYMWPAEIRFLDALPLTANGKYDRKELARRTNS